MRLACPSAQRSCQRATHWLLLPQSAPTCTSKWSGSGVSPGLLLCGSISSPTPTRGRRQMSPQISALGLVFWLQVLLLVNWALCLYQLGGWDESCQWQATTFPVHQPSFAQLPWLVRPKLPNPGSPTDQQITRRARHRFHVSWKVLKVCQREVIEP